MSKITLPKKGSLCVPPTDELYDLGRATRDLTHTMLKVGQVPDDIRAEMNALRDQMAALTETLESHTLTDQMPCFAGNYEPNVRPYYVNTGLIGDHNPLAPLFEVEHADDVTTGTITFEIGYEGPPGCVHGGFVSFFYDQILSHHILEIGMPSMTGTLSVRYESPTPIMTELEFEVITKETTETKVMVEGIIKANGKICNRSEGIFVRAKDKNFLGRIRKEMNV